MTDEKKEVSLQEVYDLIKKEGKKQLVFSAVVYGATIVIAGVSMLFATFPASYSLRWNAVVVIIIGAAFMLLCVKKAMSIKR
jgi:cytochrome b subunit of formate dehydrogenase